MRLTSFFFSCYSEIDPYFKKNYIWSMERNSTSRFSNFVFQVTFIKLWLVEPTPTNTACEHNLLTFVNISYVHVEIILWSIVTLWLFKGNLVGCVTIWKRSQKSDLRLKSLFLFLYEQLLLSQLIFQLPRIKISKSGIPG